MELWLIIATLDWFLSQSEWTVAVCLATSALTWEKNLWNPTVFWGWALHKKEERCLFKSVSQLTVRDFVALFVEGKQVLKKRRTLNHWFSGLVVDNCITASWEGVSYFSILWSTRYLPRAPKHRQWSTEKGEYQLARVSSIKITLGYEWKQLKILFEIMVVYLYSVLYIMLYMPHCSNV